MAEPAAVRPPPSTTWTKRMRASRIPAQIRRLFIHGLVPFGSLSGFMFGSRSAIIYSHESGTLAGAPHGQPEPPSVSPALNRILRGKRNVRAEGERGLTVHLRHSY